MTEKSHEIKKEKKGERGDKDRSKERAKKKIMLER